MPRSLLLLATATLFFAGVQTTQQELALDLPSGRSSAVLELPAAPARPPVVLVAAGTPSDAAAIAGALASNGVAALRVTAPAPSAVGATTGPDAAAATLAQWIAHLRNDERFPTVTVFADATALEAAVIAARVARADGVVTRSASGAPSAAAASEIARLVAQTRAITTTAPADTASALAEFAKSVPTLGRRGTRAARPDTKRGSPRRVLLTTVGSTRIGIEWGSPQKKGRAIWGALIKWDNVWMPGADEATTLTTNAPITIGTLSVPAGDHTIYTHPTADRFDLIISRDVGQFHTVRDTALELGRVPLTHTSRADVVEGLTFAIDQTATGATFKLIWDDREYFVQLATNK